MSPKRPSRVRRRSGCGQAPVAQSRASLEAVRTDLGKTDILSPINGVVLVRSVEPGQTVAASLQAPILFTLAEDLKKMELHVAVDEADVGSVQSVSRRASRSMRFRVGTFPRRSRRSISPRATRRSASIVQHLVAGERDLDRRRDLRDGARSRQLRPAAATRHDGDGADRHDEHRGRPADSQCGAALHAGRRRTFPARPARKRSAGGPLSALMPRCRARVWLSAASNQQGGGAAWAAPGFSRTASRRWSCSVPGATDGRFTQVLELGPTCRTGGRMGADRRTTRDASRRSSASSSRARRSSSTQKRHEV